MRRIGYPALLSILALASIGAGAAHADSWGIDPAEAIAAESLTALTLEIPGEATIRCNVTLRGSFNSSVEQRAGEAVGSLSAVNWSSCTGGEIVRANGLPWTITFSSQLGSLPEAVTGVLTQLRGLSFTISVPGYPTCTFTGTPGALIGLSGRGPFETGLMTLLSGTLTSVTCCGRRGSLEAAFRLTPTQRLIAVPALPMTANPAWISRARAVARGGSQSISFTAAQLTTVTATGLRLGNVGWILEGEPPPAGCNRAYRRLGEGCSVTVIAEANAGDDVLQLTTAEGAVVGRSNLLR